MKAGLKIQPKKCIYAKRQVKFLGRIINKEGITADPKSIVAISNFSVPQSATDLESFNAMVGYYRKFIPNYAHLTKNLTPLTNKDVNFQKMCTEDHLLDFNNLKQKLCEKPVLARFDSKVPIIVECDECGYGIGIC